MAAPAAPTRMYAQSAGGVEAGPVAAVRGAPTLEKNGWGQEEEIIAEHVKDKSPACEACAGWADGENDGWVGEYIGAEAEGDALQDVAGDRDGEGNDGADGCEALEGAGSGHRVPAFGMVAA